MRQFIIRFCLLGSLFVYALSLNFFENLLMFVLFGAIPGTSTSLTPAEMAWLLAGTGAVVVLAYFRRPVTSAIASFSTAVFSQLSKIRLPQN